MGSGRGGKGEGGEDGAFWSFLVGRWDVRREGGRGRELPGWVVGM